MISETFNLIYKYKEAFGEGLLVTLELVIIVWILGILIGSAFGFLASKYKKILGVPLKIISFLLSGIPILVFLFWLHYPAQSILNINVSPFITATFMLTIINILAVADSVKNGIENIPYQYIEVAKISGVSPFKRALRIELPLIFRHIFPTVLSTQVNMLHMSLFASLISVNEIFRVAQRVISIEYKPVEIYTALGIFFLLISLPLNGIAYYFKQKYNRNLSER